MSFLNGLRNGKLRESYKVMIERAVRKAQKDGLTTREIRGLLACYETTSEETFFCAKTAERLMLPKDRRPVMSPIMPFEEIAAGILGSQVTEISKMDKLWPRETLVIDFSSPNIAKPFHVGHLNSTILGNYLANLKRFLGDEVVRINYLGDWGTQFGILCAAFRLFGNDSLLDQDPLKHLVEVYVKGNELASQDENFKQEAIDMFAKLESNDSEVKELWWKFRDISLREYFKIYERLGIRFDLIQGESAYHKDANAIVDIFRDRKLLEDDQGLLGVRLKEDNRFAPIMKANGSTLYLTRDICAALDRKRKYGPSSIYYCVDVSQTQHFKDLTECLHLLDQKSFQVVHVPFRRIEGLSTRKGQIYPMKDLITEVTARALEQLKRSKTSKVPEERFEKTATILGLSAIYVNTLRSRRLTKEKFSWDNCFALKGDSGIFLQYTHARLCSLLDVNSKIEAKLHEDKIKTLLQDDNFRDAIVRLANFQATVLRSDCLLEPSEIILYSFRLCHETGRLLQSLRIAENDVATAETGLLLYKKLQETLAECLKLIGVQPLRKM